jgi:GNAT superfamily N-acetyltransferase
MSGGTSIVRPASLDDTLKIVELGERFYRDEGEHAASPAELTKFIVSHICDPERVCLVAGESVAAVLCGVMIPHYFTGDPTAFKTAWYARPGARGLGAHLLRAFEGWAKEKGARRIIVSGRSERTLRLLSLRNYSPLETVYSKDLQCPKPHSPCL